MGFQVLGQLLDLGSQDGDLNLRRTSIAVVSAEFFNDFFFVLFV
jgi:hypothetical protein